MHLIILYSSLIIYFYIMKHIQKGVLYALFCPGLFFISPVHAGDISVKITKKYLNIPVSHQTDRIPMKLSEKDKKIDSFNIRLAPEQADYWVFYDVSSLKGKTVKISIPGENNGLKAIYQDDVIAGSDSLYKETYRPQFHFSSRRGWNNDPNGMIYYDGEYHLFYQHNPYEREWENMHWGHAVSKDLIHWEELGDALRPDSIGSIFSGSCVIDYENTAGFNQGKTPAMVAIYTADNPQKQVQCIAYSLDKGRTWTKYKGNPVIDSNAKWKTKDTRDPKVFWYKPGKEWVMVLNERDGHSIYTSTDLKEWNYQSHITGFWECPELFELPVNGDPENTRWVMYGASGTYMIGTFDGKKFTPENGKFYYNTGAMYAAQTFTNMPASDNRRIQIGWERITHPGMPFKGMMSVPTVLSLKATPNGIRLFSVPVQELEKLQDEKLNISTNLTARKASELLQPFNKEGSMRIRLTMKLSHATDAGLNLYGQSLLHYDMNSNRVNGVFYSPADCTSMEITADILIDRTSVEVFIDNGAYSYSMERKPHNDNNEGFHFWGNNIEIKNLKLYKMQSIWK